MSSSALIVGIDSYVQQPLTSAVNDARSFKELLLELSLVPPENILMLTSPPTGNGREAKRKNITDALYEFYARGDGINRLYFFYAGHGLLAFADAARGRPRTLLMPAEIEDLDRDGQFLIDIDEVIDRMKLNGPQEQFYFVDACRDLAYERHPDFGGLGWSGRPPGHARSQVILFAVSPLGKARAQKEGLGVMTRHLLDAFRGTGIALEYNPVSDQYEINHQSVRNYVREAVELAVVNEPAWTRKYQLPQLIVSDPVPGPIRIVTSVAKAPLSVHIDPDIAAERTHITTSQRRNVLPQYCWPPRTNHETVELEPQLYLLKAQCAGSTPDPQTVTVDLRKVNQVKFTVRDTATSALADVPVPDLGPAPALATFDVPSARRPKGPGAPIAAPVTRVRAHAQEPQVMIELEAVEPPYEKWSGRGELDQEVDPGPYRVSFRLGSDYFSKTEVYVREGETAKVSPAAAMTPLVREALEETRAILATTQISESIGDIQAAILPTMLPILGIKPFDVKNELFHRFEGVVETRDVDTLGRRPLSLVLAVDGNSWPVPPREVLSSVRCKLLISAAATAGDGVILDINPLGPQRAGAGKGLARIGLSLTKAPESSFLLEFESPYLDTFRLAGASLPERATVITVTLRPDGSTEISQNLLRFPGIDYHDELVPHVSYGRMVRELQLGQKLYQSGELGTPDNPPPGAELIRNLLYGKWTDPILGCMAYFAWHRIHAGYKQPSGWPEISESLLKHTAANLMHFFGTLADSRVLYGLANEDQRKQVFDDLLEQKEIPVLAEATRFLAQYAEGHGRTDAAVVDFSRRIPSNQIWSMNFV